MEMRISFELDKNIRDKIDRYAREMGTDRSSAILTLIEKGLANDGIDITPDSTNQRIFEEYREMKKLMNEMAEQFSSMREEVRVLKHVVDTDWKPYLEATPFQSKRWWEFWKN